MDIFQLKRIECITTNRLIQLIKGKIFCLTDSTDLFVTFFHDRFGKKMNGVKRSKQLILLCIDMKMLV